MARLADFFPVHLKKLRLNIKERVLERPVRTLWTEVGLVLRGGLLTVSLEGFRTGRLSCRTSHKLIVPSVEKETMLLAIWVPTTFREEIGYRCPSEEMLDLCTGIAFARTSQSKIVPLEHPPTTVLVE
jgi:hypothetical protein